MAAQQGLPAVLEALSRRWRLAVLAALPLALGVGLYAQTLPDEYEAETVVGFTPRLGAEVGADVIRVTLPRYNAYLTAPATVRRVAGTLDADPDAVGGAVDVSVATDTANLTVVVRGEDAGDAARTANAFAREAVTYNNTDELLQAAQVATALPPDAPAGPPRRLLQLAGLLAGLVVGVGLAFLVERGRPRVREASDVVELTGLPVLGRIPASRALRGGQTLEVTDPAVGSAVRALTVQAERAAGERRVRVLAVTSPTTGDGKTTVSVGYAAAVARRGRTVILLDADIHRAGLSESLGMTGGSGLPDLLDGTSTFDEVLRDGPVEGVKVLPSWQLPSGVDLLARRLGDVLSQALDRADLVVVDCPPVQDDDGQMVLSQTEAVLLVLRTGTPNSVVAESAQALAGLRVPVLGAVLNHASRDARPPGYPNAPLVGGA